MEGTGDGTALTDKAAVVFGKAQKALEGFPVLRDSPVLNSVYLGRVHLNMIGGEGEPKKIDDVGVELAFLCLNKEVILEQPL